MRFLKDERAQATTEYILMLSFAVMLVMMVITRLLRPGFARLTENLSNTFEKRLFRSGAMHQFPIRRPE